MRSAILALLVAMLFLFFSLPSFGQLRFVPLAGCRVVDTRNANGPFGGPAIAAQSSRDFAIPNGSCGVPSTAAAYSLNVTVFPWSTLGYLTIWASGQPQPSVSTLNSLDGRIKANAAIVQAGNGGAVSIYVTDTTNVVLDINGYFLPASDPSAPLAFFALTPCRVADTRNTSGPLGGPSLVAQQARSFPILSSSCNIPPTAQAYSLNFTVMPPGTFGYLTAWPTGQAQPSVSTLNAPTGTYTANAAMVQAGTSGAISTYVTDSTDLVIDVNGYFAPLASNTDPLSLYMTPPCRVMDTRNTTGPFVGEISVYTTPCSISQNAQTVVLNAAVMPSQTLGFLALWAYGQAWPGVSTLNALDGFMTSNMAIVPASDGVIDAYATDLTQLVLDTSGYFASTPVPVISELSPNSGPVGTSVTIGGSNFGATQGSSTVTFNGTPATPIISWSDSVIVAAVPGGASTGNVAVTVYGIASNGVPFTVLPAPSITSVSPPSGAVGAPVTITGLNFGATQGTSIVTFNGEEATPTSWNVNSIGARVPSNATTGNVVLIVNGVLSNGYGFTVTNSGCTLDFTGL